MNNYAKQQILRMETQAKFPYLIEITYYYNETSTTTARYANSDNDIRYKGNDYLASCFSLQLPEKKTGNLGNAKIQISAIDQTWIKRIRENSKRAKIKFIALIQYEENNTPKVEPIEELEMTLTSAQWDENTIQWNMIFDDLHEVNVPLDIITNTICPALA